MRRSYAAPPGYYAGLCRPLTRRIMLGGVPFEALMILIFSGMQILNFKIYAFLVVLPVVWWLLKTLYARDEWGVGAWLDHARSVTQGTTRMEV